MDEGSGTVMYRMPSNIYFILVDISAPRVSWNSVIFNLLPSAREEQFCLLPGGLNLIWTHSRVYTDE